MFCKKRIVAVGMSMCLAGAIVAGTHFARADDMSMSKDMSADMMGKMKQMMSDPSMMPSTDDMAKAKAMHEMAAMMAKDPDMQKMSMDMMKGGDQSKMMMPTDDAVAKAKDDLMKDPAAMKMVMANAMMMSMMHDKMPMNGDDMKMNK